jgi:hypothetical protein
MNKKNIPNAAPEAIPYPMPRADCRLNRGIPVLARGGVPAAGAAGAAWPPPELTPTIAATQSSAPA